MLKSLLLFITLFISVAYSRSVTFKIIAFGSKVQIEIIGSKKYTLKPTVEGDPLYSGKINNLPDADFEYTYYVDGVKENFNRVCTSGLTTTYNEFFGREETIKQLETFQYPNNHWNRSIGKTRLFDDSYIPTVHFYGNETEKFFHKPTSTSVKLERVTFYFKDSKKAFSKVPVTAKNKNFDKFQIKMKLSKSANINGRYLLKFRNGSEDPTNLRQTIYGNIIDALGMPSIHSIMVRVYYNGKPAGFYTLQEEAISESFIRSEFYGNPETETIDPPNPIGDTFDCSTGADFEYKPFNMSYYDPIELKIGNDKNKLLAFTEALDKLDTSNETELEEFDKKWFDIETFHKAMAMEYLTGDWDGYWYFTSNFAFYEDPNQSTDSTYKFYFITQDHDETFGVGLTDTVNRVGYKFPQESYTTMLNKIWHYDEFDAEHRTLVDKFIASTPALQKRFQDTLISIVQNIFNPVAFKKVVNSYYERYLPEVEWDFSFARPYTYKDSRGRGQNPNWGYNDFVKAFDSPLGGLQWGLYEWVSLRAEAIKNEFCITWEGDENPPNESCVPHDIPVPTTTINEVPTTTNEQEPTSTSTIPIEEPTTTPIPSTKSIPTHRHGFADWFKNKKPSDFAPGHRRSNTLQPPKKSRFF